MRDVDEDEDRGSLEAAPRHTRSSRHLETPCPGWDQVPAGWGAQGQRWGTGGADFSEFVQIHTCRFC